MCLLRELCVAELGRHRRLYFVIFYNIGLTVMVVLEETIFSEVVWGIKSVRTTALQNPSVSSDGGHCGS